MVWQAPIGAAIDSAAPPSLVPDQSSQTQNTLVSNWQLDRSTPGWRYYLDCEYGSAGHFILFDVTGLTVCVEHITPYSSGDKDLANARFTASCK